MNHHLGIYIINKQSFIVINITATLTASYSQLTMDVNRLLSDLCRDYDSSIILKEEQRNVLQSLLLSDRPVLANLPTGYGKSLIIHLLPAALRMQQKRQLGTVIVICPLNSIQQDQLTKLNSKNIKACSLSVSCKAKQLNESSEDDIDDNLVMENCNIDEIVGGYFDLIYAHPEAFFNTKTGKELLRNEKFTDNVIGVCVDECHILLEW